MKITDKLMDLFVLAGTRLRQDRVLTEVVVTPPDLLVLAEAINSGEWISRDGYLWPSMYENTDYATSDKMFDECMRAWKRAELSDQVCQFLISKPIRYQPPVCAINSYIQYSGMSTPEVVEAIALAILPNPHEPGAKSPSYYLNELFGTSIDPTSLSFSAIIDQANTLYRRKRAEIVKDELDKMEQRRLELEQELYTLHAN